MIFSMLTGTYKEMNSTDCDDWEDTLQYVRGGLKQKEIEIQEQIKKWKNYLKCKIHFTITSSN